ncbi:MAG: iron-sulfur cluster assembly accessory protein [Flavobacteriales bacterium]|nr:iron-sulfur cluster assembly accessory protein [Flavobacteriales bacterium]
MIKVSDNAKQEFTKLLGTEGRGPQHFVRVGVKGGGCSGLSYDLVFDDKMMDGDKVFEDNGVKVVVDKKSLLYLLGTTLDFSGGLNGKGFQFVNPNASRTCGCGEFFDLNHARNLYNEEREGHEGSKRQGGRHSP